MSERKPHKAVILVRVEIHPLLQSGECSGNPVMGDKLNEYGIKPHETFCINGEDLDDCLRKTREVLDVFK